ncbi:hypothetical protein GY45DRAFT_598961 [Cubamyces sp. BRFM 1775]|nr:hypothetical protein GY45DRAFT_598961 [Cubamyces sp. BRFM 1775]
MADVCLQESEKLSGFPRPIASHQTSHLPLPSLISITTPTRWQATAAMVPRPLRAAVRDFVHIRRTDSEMSRKPFGRSVRWDWELGSIVADAISATSPRHLPRRGVDGSALSPPLSSSSRPQKLWNYVRHWLTRPYIQAEDPVSHPDSDSLYRSRPPQMGNP